MDRPSFIAVPLPLLSLHDNVATFRLRDWDLLLIVVAAFALGWISSRIREHYREHY
jgi:hypothetical protein